MGRMKTREVRLSYSFTPTEKRGMIAVLDKYPTAPEHHDAIRNCLRLEGDTILFADEARYLAGIIRPYYGSLAERLERHPVLSSSDIPVQLKRMTPEQQGQALLTWPDGKWQICNQRLTKLLVSLGVLLMPAVPDAIPIKPVKCFSPNGIVTEETCPVCQEPGIQIEHGREVLLEDRQRRDTGRYQHYEHCPECGDSTPIVCYDCEHCSR